MIIMPYLDTTPSKIIKSKDFLLIVLGFTVLCIFRVFHPHPHIKDTSSKAFYEALIGYTVINAFLIFLYELLVNAFSKGDEFNKALPYEKWLVRLLAIVFLDFWLALPKDDSWLILIPWLSGIVSAYYHAKLRLRKVYLA
ncbi:hypothetical protein OCC_08949 [Thermococcus litoralis DSM 5473]|uniref:Uncharacterized protein n=2 Tax=Thermococcus litoralis TaxID=2265 RepID=H3ZKB4_THELN|nr:hypothetical protein ADU37_CDS14060 [Thermococcus sp. 2319x1]EHR79667.2 hypothetical protein OCC_08949 [Thermococcus litoralis DSM 5473]